MKKLIILLFFGWLSCSIHQGEKWIFENNLPKDDLTILNEWVVFYEDLIKKNYVSLSPKNAIKVLLKDMLNDTTEYLQFNKTELKQLLHRTETSTLLYKSEKAYYDTVYYSNECNFDGKIEYSEHPFVIAITQEGDTICQNIVVSDWETKTELELIKEDGYFRLIHDSSFFEGLKAIQSDDLTISEFIKLKESSGGFSSNEVASSFILGDFDFEDYFVKRIIVVEVVIPYFLHLK